MELLSEAILISAVCLKAIGLFDECIEYLRGEAATRELSQIEGVPLTRQEVMMSEDEKRHLALAADSPSYRALRPREYFRTLKRVFEALLRAGHVRAAAELAPEYARAFENACTYLSASARISFYKNIGQLLAARGETYRAMRLLDLCLQASELAGLNGQRRQLLHLLQDVTNGRPAVLETFRATLP